MTSAPPPETRFRRANFVGGLPIRMADGQDWAFAGPREIATAEAALRLDVVRLLNAIAQAETVSDRLRGELALAICLLSLNYHLAPKDYERLLVGSVGDPRMDAFQAEFHVLASRHAEAFLPREQGPPADHGRRFRFPAFLPHRRATDSGVRDQKAS